jgi:hypothetical protein
MGICEETLSLVNTPPEKYLMKEEEKNIYKDDTGTIGRVNRKRTVRACGTLISRCRT